MTRVNDVVRNSQSKTRNLPWGSAYELFTLIGHDLFTRTATPALPVESEARKEVGKNLEANLNEPPLRKWVSWIIITSAPEALKSFRAIQRLWTEPKPFTLYDIILKAMEVV